MDQDALVLEWARQAHFAQPLRWGEVEAGILAREPAPSALSRREGLLAGGIGGLGYLFLAVFVAITWGAAVIGLVLVGVGTRREPAMASGWYEASVAAFVVACLSQVNSIRVWLETRSRSLVNALACGIAVLCSGAAYLLLASTDDLPAVSWLSLLILANGIVGAVAVFPLVFSKPEGRKKNRTPPRRGPSDDAMRARYRDTRDAVVKILTHRRLVKLYEGDRTRLLEMPLGYWDELDGVGEDEWRRILELRSVGWRDFDERDRRPWPARSSRPR